MDALLTSAALAVLGAAITVAFNQVTSLLEKRSNRKALAYAIAAELEALRSRYVQSVTGRGGELFDYGFEEPRFDYFVVFQANAAKVGALDEQDAADVVRVYVQAKGHFENVINWTKWKTEEWPDDIQHDFKAVMQKDHDQLLTDIPAICKRLRNY